MAKRKAAPLDPLDAFAQEATLEPERAVEMMFWLDRFRNPEFALRVTEKDLAGFRACVQYLDVRPQVTIVRPQGHPGSPGRAATKTARAIPAIPAEGPRPYVIIQMTDAQGNAFKPIENNEADAQTRDRENALRRWRDKGPQLAQQLRTDMAGGTFSTATINEACSALDALARA